MMKINKAIMSSNNNRLYLDFWDKVSYVWKEKFDIEPILIHIKDTDEDIEIDTTYGKVITIDPIDGYPIYVQALFVRYWYTQFLGDDIGIISDIDMFPIGEDYFVNQIQDIPDDKYVHLNPCLSTYGMYPSCYHVASGNSFKKYLELEDSFEDSLAQLKPFCNNMLPGNPFWYTDELYGSSKLEKISKDVFIPISRRGGQNGGRIDRPTWHYDIEGFNNNIYIDSHSVRPYHENKETIDTMVDYIINQQG